MFTFVNLSNNYIPLSYCCCLNSFIIDIIPCKFAHIATYGKSTILKTMMLICAHIRYQQNVRYALFFILECATFSYRVKIHNVLHETSCRHNSKTNNNCFYELWKNICGYQLHLIYDVSEISYQNSIKKCEENIFENHACTLNLLKFANNF